MEFDSFESREDSEHNGAGLVEISDIFVRQDIFCYFVAEPFKKFTITNLHPVSLAGCNTDQTCSLHMHPGRDTIKPCDKDH